MRITTSPFHSGHAFAATVLLLAALLVGLPATAAELEVNGSADYKGSYGLQVNLSDTSAAYVQDDTPAAEVRYRARFAFDPKTIDTIDGESVDLLVGLDGSSSEIFRVVLINTSGQLQIALEDILSGQATAPGDRATLNPYWNVIEIDWVAADSGSNGSFSLWLDGHPQNATGLSSLGNGAGTIDSIRLGTANTAVGAPTGRFYADEFSSNRESYIGLVQPFDDVASSSNLFTWITAIYNAGITGGCGVDQYCDSNPITRAQMAVFLLKSAEGRDYVPPACTTPVFDDVPCSNGFSRWINELAARGVTGGCGNGNFCPDDPVTRAQMAVFLLKTREGSAYSPPACTTATFSDVPCDGFAADWIQELANRNITGGCGGGNYCPADSVTRGQMAVFITKTFELPQPQN